MNKTLILCIAAAASIGIADLVRAQAKAPIIDESHQMEVKDLLIDSMQLQTDIQTQFGTRISALDSRRRAVAAELASICGDKFTPQSVDVPGATKDEPPKKRIVCGPKEAAQQPAPPAKK